MFFTFFTTVATTLFTVVYYASTAFSLTVLCAAFMQCISPNLLAAICGSLLPLLSVRAREFLIGSPVVITPEPTTHVHWVDELTQHSIYTAQPPAFPSTHLAHPPTYNPPPFAHAPPTFRDYTCNDHTKSSVNGYLPVQDPFTFKREFHNHSSLYSTPTASPPPPYRSGVNWEERIKPTIPITPNLLYTPSFNVARPPTHPLTPLLHGLLDTPSTAVIEPPAATPTSYTQLLFEGPCGVAWEGPSGINRHGSLWLTVGQSIDTHAGTPTGEPILTFYRDNTSIDAFTVTGVLPAERSDNVPIFPFRLRRICDGSEDNVIIGMLEGVASQFCQATRLALPLPPPPKETQSPIHPPPPTVSPPSQFPTQSPTTPTPTSTSTNPLQVTLLDPTRPIPEHIYDMPCTRIFKGIHYPSSLHYRYAASRSAGKMEWQVAFPPASRNKKRDWYSIDLESSHWQHESLRNREPGRRVSMQGTSMKASQAGELEEIRVIMRGALATRFCDWTSIRELSSNGSVSQPGPLAPGGFVMPSLPITGVADLQMEDIVMGVASAPPSTSIVSAPQSTFGSAIPAFQ
ncbi:hypothetical protein FRB94_013329 [Tulasnella sp. JGI-2019a]|nr:hypothetical protein FRB94_013329 [Tulasnella sp. JGI-2019a]